MTDELSSWLLSREKDYGRDMTRIKDILDISVQKMGDQSTMIGSNSSKLGDLSGVHIEAERLRKARQQLYAQEVEARKYIAGATFNPAPLGTEQRALDEENAQLLRLSLEAKQLQFTRRAADTERNLKLAQSDNLVSASKMFSDTLDVEAYLQEWYLNYWLRKGKAIPGENYREPAFVSFNTVKAVNQLNKEIEDQRQLDNIARPAPMKFKEYVPQILQLPKHKHNWTGLDMLQDSRARLQETKGSQLLDSEALDGLGYTNEQVLDRFERLIERNTVEIPQLPDFEPRNIKPNTAPVYLASLPTYDFTELTLPGLQSLFGTLTTKLQETEESLYITYRSEARIALFRERDILQKTLGLLTDMIITRKREEMVGAAETERRLQEERIRRIQMLLQQDANQYDAERAGREYEISLIQQKEIDRIKEAKGKKVQDKLDSSNQESGGNLDGVTAKKLAKLKDKAEVLAKPAKEEKPSKSKPDKDEPKSKLKKKA